MQTFLLARKNVEVDVKASCILTRQQPQQSQMMLKWGNFRGLPFSLCVLIVALGGMPVYSIAVLKFWS